ncbi:hypothetical protein G5B40_17705 [Pikeienuella piscinae]|uniref:Uncharacterized protein n=1 Tax=Pikeienuella piscinae TaxID=2748098 RepID=A0A7L5C134_9RHOB|nr:hypothetical protein [Pikeienuella piscinae]QIE57113.1 hypothetical protein G5B40_17705 [Pikeienuella piscinae]
MPYDRIHSDDGRDASTSSTASSGGDSFAFVASPAMEIEDTAATAPFDRIVNDTVQGDQPTATDFIPVGGAGNDTLYSFAGDDDAANGVADPAVPFHRLISNTTYGGLNLTGDGSGDDGGGAFAAVDDALLL